MRYETSPLRPGMTAIVAVLALSATPLFAQSAEPAAAPVTVTPPPAAAPAPAPAAAPATTLQTAAPIAAPVVNAPPPPVRLNLAAPQGPGITKPIAAPVVEEPAPAPKAAAPKAATRTTNTRSTAKTTTTAAPAVPATPPVLESTAAPVAAPVPAPVAAPAPAPVAAPSPVAKQTTTTQTSDDVLPIAGLAGVAALALAGGAFALGRRRRKDEDEIDYVETETVAEPAVAPVQPAYATVEPAVAFVGENNAARQPQPQADIPVTAATTRLPAGFDLSRFGRHAQAAYRGPTADNPFLSLRRRLKRAAFFDQREREAREGGPALAYATAPAAQPAMAARTTEHVTTRVNRPPRPAFRPAYSS